METSDSEATGVRRGVTVYATSKSGKNGISQLSPQLVDLNRGVTSESPASFKNTGV